MEELTLEFLNAIDESVLNDDWKAALDSLFSTLRKGFVFDNLAIYLAEGDQGLPEVVYARAVGRGRSAEADAAWGENIANQVFNSGRLVQESPQDTTAQDRVRMPYLLGLPLLLQQGKGAVVFVRFGGPQYTSEHIQLAALVAAKITHLFDRRALREHTAQLKIVGQQAQLQDDFIATISHDLRTPLGFIKGYTTSLLRSDTTWDPQTQKEFLTIIDEEADHLMALIDRLLDSALLKNGAMLMDFQPVRMDSLIRDVILRVCSRKKSLVVELDLDNAPPIQADSVRLAQVFENLLDNAVKYAPHSPVTISLHFHGDHLSIVFADQGPGIPPEHLPFLFDRFYRPPGQSTQRGTGLGLFICREIIRAHHGQITVDTAPGKGTAFYIELPVSH